MNFVFNYASVMCSAYRADKGLEQVFTEQSQGHRLGKELYIWGSLKCHKKKQNYIKAITTLH